jgi:hypothetical protein
MEMGDFAAHDSTINESGTIFVASINYFMGVKMTLVSM